MTEIEKLQAENEKLKAYLTSRQGLDLPILLGFEAGVNDGQEEREELIERLEASQAELSELKGKNEQLKERIAELESDINQMKDGFC